VSPPSRLSDPFNAATLFVDRHLAEGRGGRLAFRHGGRSITYAALAESVNRAGNALAGRGVEIEQRVLLALADGPAFAAVFWGAVKLGAVAVPVNPLLTAEEYVSQDVTFSASKMYFAFGLGNTLYFPLRVEAASLLVPERLSPERAFEIIATERPTVFFAVATLYARMLRVAEAERRWDLSSLRLCVSSGEALPPPVFDAWKARFGHELLDVVGSTEALQRFRLRAS
jgi:acyl-coenzyme A synthetase/AMP-(fatty) acid ligase